ncbi:MAG: PEGA domain-containing protein [Sorangiineae bacterium]|nr:PEGA domain-containing protein [Polyangiaceae bacterium]MEB2321076.1 PEGA domain-containing protein [Sorangiineae bacterium]
MNRLLIAVGSLLVSLASGVALAQPADAPPAPPAPSAPPATETDTKAQARAHFEKAISLFEEEAWDAALVEFQRSRELYPTRAATKNAALCLRKLHRFDEALDMFETLLKSFPDLPADDRALAEREIKALSSLVGTLGLTGGEAGASVVVDGRVRGTLPSAPVRVPAGTHFVRVTKEGFLPFEVQAEVVGGQSTAVAVTMRALTQGGRLKVTEESGKIVDVVVDGEVVGKTPWAGTLPVGDHVVFLRGEGNIGTQPASAPVRLNQVTPLMLAVEALDAVLRVEPAPASANVAIDGVVVGRGVWEGKLRAGAHKIEVAEEGFLPSSKQVVLTRDKRQVLALPLERDPDSALWRAKNPARFIFELDGAGIFAPLLGGDIVTRCSGSCAKSPGIGFAAIGHAGYQFGSGLGFSVDAGYLMLGKTITGRDLMLQPQGFAPVRSTADDTLKLSGVLLGASAQLHRGERFPLTFRLGVGAMLGTARYQRTGTAQIEDRYNEKVTPPRLIPAHRYSFTSSGTTSPKYLYAAPEVRVGLKLAERLELGIGVQALVLFAISQPKTKGRGIPIDPGALGKMDLMTEEQLTGNTVVLLAPNLGLRYEL